MNLYSFDVPIHATLYVKAASADEARKLAIAAVDGAALEVSTRSSGDIDVSDCQFEDPDLPAVSFSPAMTVGAISPDAMAEMASEDIDEDEDADGVLGLIYGTDDEGRPTIPGREDRPE